ncbi:cysteine proteinase [Hypoxylon trugodes]|uniref:cysteine proteinase n=1 Tax=Hypoxylon trugodes TaxID=326681 RepID=UPI0021A15DC1|nr:cysteine proteinase [Hypoxylon trugodes]KAI1385232.1 cysteine proteinase [Hypoxylon trugodes]
MDNEPTMENETSGEIAGEPPDKGTRPKRKAAQVAKEIIDEDDTSALLDNVLSAMSEDEHDEYLGWVELESEPAFFNAMLLALGTVSFKVQEVYSLDTESLKSLSHPVHGFIFCFEYEGDSEPSHEKERQDCPPGLWFANQTAGNACATVALTNIIMNAKDVNLGGDLQGFREETSLLPPPHRGRVLDEDDFIRSVHNSVARRIDLLAEDLVLDNKYEESLKKKRPRGKSSSSSSSRQSRKKRNIETNYHYIAYVPVNGQVWELDGFQVKPLCLGPVGDSWLEKASAAIQERMLRNEFAPFSLLAISNSPLLTLSRKLSISLACSHTLHELFSKDPAWVYPDPFETYNDERLDRLFIERDQIVSLEPDDFKVIVSQPGFTVYKALKYARSLQEEQEVFDAKYAVELAAAEDALETIRGRQRDYTPAIHEWVKVLAEKGVLRELILEMDGS